MVRTMLENIIIQLYSKADGQRGAPVGIARNMNNNDVLRNLKWYIEAWREMGDDAGKSQAFDDLLEDARQRIAAKEGTAPSELTEGM